MKVHADQLPGQTLRVEGLTFWFDMCTTGFHPAAEADIGFLRNTWKILNWGFLDDIPVQSFFLLSVQIAHATINSSSNDVRLQHKLLQELRLALQCGNTCGIHLEYRGHDDYNQQVAGTSTFDLIFASSFFLLYTPFPGQGYQTLLLGKRGTILIPRPPNLERLVGTLVSLTPAVIWTPLHYQS